MTIKNESLSHLIVEDPEFRIPSYDVQSYPKSLEAAKELEPSIDVTVDVYDALDDSWDVDFDPWVLSDDGVRLSRTTTIYAAKA